ncbi:chromate efflux transporter [Bdellovibrio bacteriovorus]
MVELFWLFLKLGATSFGGPAAHIAMMEEEFVHRRQWLTREKFLQLMALTNLIPGPNSTELAIHIGYQKAGWRGFFIAGLSFILPAFILVTAIAWFYQTYSNLPQVQDFLWGVKAVVFALILIATERFLKQILKIEKYKELTESFFWSRKQRVLIFFIIFVSLYLASTNVNEVAILFNCGMISFFISRRLSPNSSRELGSLFLIFLKIGSILFGSGYVLMSFLQRELVLNRGWITEAQLLDAISVGQFTPGPVFTTASFVGYLLHGVPGATIATLGIFLPAFIFVALSIWLYKKVADSLVLVEILNGVIAGSIGLLIYTLWVMGHDFSKNLSSVLIFVVAFLVLKFSRISSPLLILMGGLLSLIAAKI